MVERIYLDWNATTPLRPQARAAAAEALGLCGNPSSVHAEGRAVRRRIEEARESVAALVGAEPRNVVFTSGGTEANMMVLSPFIGTGQESEPRDCLVISAIEHPSGDVLLVDHGSLYLALQRLENRGWLKAAWRRVSAPYP